MPESKYGDKIHTIKIGRFEEGTFKYIFLPQVEIGNELCCLNDDTTKSGCIERYSIKEAKEAGAKALEELKALEALQRLEKV